MVAVPQSTDSYWPDNALYQDAERKLHESNKLPKTKAKANSSSSTEEAVTEEYRKWQKHEKLIPPPIDSAIWESALYEHMPKNEKKLKKDLSNEKLQVQKNASSSKQNRITTASNSNSTPTKCVCPHNVVEAPAAAVASVVPSTDISAAAAAAKTKKQKKKEKKAAAKNAAASSTTSVVKVETSNQVEKIVEAVAQLTTTAPVPPVQKAKEGGKDKKSKAEKKKLNEANNKEAAKSSNECPLLTEISKARQHIKHSLERMDDIAAIASTPGKELLERIAQLEKQNEYITNVCTQLRQQDLEHTRRIEKLEQLVQTLSGGKAGPSSAAAAAPAAAAAAKDSDDDDGVDLFGSDDEEEAAEAAKIREQRLADYAAKKSKKPALIAKSNVIFDVKPWDDETDMKEIENKVREIKLDGLLWGASKLVPLAFGIMKLQITSVVEDEKVSIDEVTELIEANEDLVQSVDIAAFNKI